MEIKNVEVSILREGIEGQTIVTVCFSEPKDTKIILTDNNSDDIENLFNNIFEWIIGNNKLLQFNLNDEDKDLFNEVVKEILRDLNSEIMQSCELFSEIIEITKNSHEYE